MAKQKHKIKGFEIVVTNARLSFATLAEPKVPEQKGGRAYWGADFILDPKVDPKHKTYIADINENIERIKDELKSLTKNKRNHADIDDVICWRKATERQNAEGEIYDGYKSKTAWNITARANGEKPRPTCLSRDKRRLTDPDKIDEILYSGAYVDAKVGFWAQADDNGFAVRCMLLGVRKRAEGDAFGARSASADDFEDLEDDDFEDEFESKPSKKTRRDEDEDEDEDEEDYSPRSKKKAAKPSKKSRRDEEEDDEDDDEDDHPRSRKKPAKKSRRRDEDDDEDDDY